ncbi:MAG: NADH:flavin oxidoreductase/NADH oxidase family protein [Pseudomonadota bacterium]
MAKAGSDLTAPLILPCGARIKNRLAKAAMTEGLADSNNSATSRHAQLYERWGDGGPGLLITGNVMVDKRYLERPGNIAIDGEQSKQQILALEAIASAAVDSGAAIWMQLSHAGRQTPTMVAPEPVGPSAVSLKLPGGQFGKPRALLDCEIEDVIQRFAYAAGVAKSAGFTGVQVHAAHGYLISGFLNPLANQRTDKWGGSLENRARLLMRCIEVIRAKTGSGFPIAVKLNSSDFQKGGFSFDDCLVVVEMLNQVGVDLIEISGGNYEQPRMLGFDGVEPLFEDAVPASTAAREAYFLSYAEQVAKVAVPPLMVTGGFRSRKAMDEALISGAADVIGIGRPLCVNPTLPNLLLAGEIKLLPKYEEALRLGPGVFGPRSPIALLKMINSFAVMAFYYENIFRLADGLDGKEEMALLPAFFRYQSHERKAAAALRAR